MNFLGNLASQLGIKTLASERHRQDKSKHVELDQALTIDGFPLKTGADGRRNTDTSDRFEMTTASLRKAFPQ